MNIRTTATLAALALVASATVGYGVATASPAAPNGPSTGAALRAAQLRTLSAASAPALPQLAFTAIPSCRAVNTYSAGGRIANGTTRTFHVTGTGSMTSQGGPSTGCGIPNSATAVSARLTSYSPLANGALVAYPTGSPAQGTYYFQKGLSSSDGGTLTLGSSGRLSVRDSGGPAYALLDVNGYWSPQIHAVLNSSGGVYTGSPHVLSSTETSAGHYQVVIDRDLTGCTPIASIYGGPFYATATVSGDTVNATTYYGSGANDGTALGLYWTLTVVC